MYTKTVLGLMVAAAAVSGCTEPRAELGDVTLALTAPASDGSIYRLTPGTRLALYGGPFYDEYALDGDGVVRVELPPGAFQAELLHPDGYDAVWPLERREPDGTVSTVLATLTTMMPASVTVVADASTPLVLSFQVEHVGPVTFASGDLDVSIDVDEIPSDGGNLAIAHGDLTAASVTVEPGAPPALGVLLPAVGQGGNLRVSVRTIGEWARTSATGACAEAEVAGHVIGGHDGFVELLIEAASATGAQLCVYTADGASQAELFFYRFGPAASSLLGGFGDHDFLTYGSVLVDLPEVIFDGHTLHLDDLVGVRDLPATLVTAVSARPAATTGPRARWYRGTFTGTMTFQFGANP